MKVLETRKEGCFTMRRKRKPNGRIVKTMEIPWPIWMQVRSSALARLKGFEEAETWRDRKQDILNLLAEGHKHEYIAATVGTSQSYVSKVNRKAKAK